MKKDIGKWLILFGVCLACFGLIRLLFGVKDTNLILYFIGLGIFLAIIGDLLLVIQRIRKKNEGIKKQNPNGQNIKKFVTSLAENSLPLRAVIAALILIAYFIWKSFIK
jgi:hypothetical protein